MKKKLNEWKNRKLKELVVPVSSRNRKTEKLRLKYEAPSDKKENDKEQKMGEKRIHKYVRLREIRT